MAIQVGVGGRGLHVWVNVGVLVVSVRTAGGQMDGTLFAVPVLVLRGARSFLSCPCIFLYPFDSTSLYPVLGKK